MKTINDKVTVTSKNAKGEEVTLENPVSYPELESKDDFLTYLSTADDKAFKHFMSATNYGLNLKARASVRAELLAKLEGPDKSINKSVESFLKTMQQLGVPMTEEQARATILANIEAAKAAQAA